jgi:hypothetical protein
MTNSFVVVPLLSEMRQRFLKTEGLKLQELERREVKITQEMC